MHQSIDNAMDPARGARSTRGGSALRRALGLPAVALLALGACDELISDPPETTPEPPPARATSHTIVVAWNELARNLVSVHRTNPPVASRAYALLSVAQYDALKRLREADVEGAADLDAVAVSTASAAVLAYLYAVDPNSLAPRPNTGQDALAASADRSQADVSTAIAAGKAAAEAVIARARTDGSDALWDGEIPTGPDKWFSSAEPPVPPLLPEWGNVRPWLLESGSQLRPAPPPELGSAEFESALAEVREFSDNRTEEQQGIAEFWEDGPGTWTPPGHWNKIAADLIGEYELDALEAARVLAYTNMAGMDAAITCWDAKYTYWLLRPTQVDPEITLAVPLPNFPAYTSGHSTFSGAAATVLGHFFPAEATRLDALAEEAAISRVYGGIHYRFDSDIGLEQGRAVGQVAIAKAEAEDQD